jgi:DNA-binding NarL/FixJ family response regulator
MGGKEIIARLLEIDPDVRAIVSSGYSNDPVMAEYEKYGFVGRVAKPYRVSELAQALRAVLAGGSGSSGGA